MVKRLDPPLCEQDVKPVPDAQESRWIKQTLTLFNLDLVLLFQHTNDIPHKLSR